MGELGTVRRYPYWSDRRIRGIAADNDVDLNRRWRIGFKTPTMGGLAPQAEFAEDRTAVQRNEIASRLERAIGKVAVEDFVTPAPATFAKGCSNVTFAAYTRWYPGKGNGWLRRKSQREAVIIHTRTKSSDGSHVEVCLFASMENCADYLASSSAEAPMWSSSSTHAIEEFISSRGKRQAAMYDDDESIAVEVLRVLNNEGMTSGHVFKYFESAEWFAEIYHDIELDKERWDLRVGMDVPEPVDRIVIGAPLWVRL